MVAAAEQAVFLGSHQGHQNGEAHSQLLVLAVVVALGSMPAPAAHLQVQLHLVVLVQTVLVASADLLLVAHRRVVQVAAAVRPEHRHQRQLEEQQEHLPAACHS